MNSVVKWDLRFLEMAHLVSGWSKDPSTKCGAVIVRPDRTVLSVGFNGFPSCMNDDPKMYQNREEKYSRVVHCEVNALIHARGSVQHCILYTHPFICCDRCVVQMMQAGIERFVYPKASEDAMSRWSAQIAKSKQYLDEVALPHSEYDIEIY